MRLINIDEIVIPSDRIRKEFNANKIKELRESIIKSGLFHPLLLRSDGRTLVAGENRLRVARDLYFEKQTIIFNQTPIPPGEIPCVLMGETDELHYLEAEFSENSRRQQLTWQEEVAYTSRYHLLQKELNPKQTYNDTAKELKLNPWKETSLGQSIILAPFLSDPEVANANTRSEALKILERKLEKGHHEAVARSLGNETKNSLHTLLYGDCRVLLPTLEHERFDAIIADPPYGVNAHLWNNMSAVEHPYLDTPEYSNEIYRSIAEHGFRTAKREAHAYIFCEFKRYNEICEIFSSFGWRIWPWPCIYWRGPANGICPWPDQGPRRTYETFIYALKGNRRTLGVFPDVLNYNDTSGVERGGHKPIELYSDILSRSCIAGNAVLDPCLGTGSILDAASSRRVRVLGIEIEAAAFGEASKRIIK